MKVRLLSKPKTLAEQRVRRIKRIVKSTIVIFILITSCGFVARSWSQPKVAPVITTKTATTAPTTVSKATATKTEMTPEAVTSTPIQPTATVTMIKTTITTATATKNLTWSLVRLNPFEFDGVCYSYPINPLWMVWSVSSTKSCDWDVVDISTTTTLPEGLAVLPMVYSEPMVRSMFWQTNIMNDSPMICQTSQFDSGVLKYKVFQYTNQGFVLGEMGRCYEVSPANKVGVIHFLVSKVNQDIDIQLKKGSFFYSVDFDPRIISGNWLGNRPYTFIP